MYVKYSVEVGKFDYVVVVGEWDGIKKKVRVWEQGCESKKVKLESFKFDDLRSGEVKIWRVMFRSWIGWEGGDNGGGVIGGNQEMLLGLEVVQFVGWEGVRMVGVLVRVVDLF